MDKKEIKKVVIVLDKSTHKAFKQYALDKDTSMQSIVETYIKRLTKKQTTPNP